MEREAPGLDAGDVQDIADELQQVFGRAIRHFDGRAIQVALVGALEGQFQHADHCIHGGANFVAHGCQEGALGAIGIVGLVLGLAQVFQQLPAFADIDPTTDNTLDHAHGIPIGQDPVVDGQVPFANFQWAVLDHGLVAGHYLEIVSMEFARLVLVTQYAIEHRPADNVFLSTGKGLQVAVIAGLQQARAVANVDRMRGAVDQCIHERQLIVQRTLGLFSLLDLSPHMGIPDQR
ncbi:hypothetical protein D3C76_1149690 [compost metagenome]